MSTLVSIIRDVKPLVLPAVKVATRVTSAYFDPEIEAAVEGALADLKRVGVSEACFSEESDFYPLVRQAVVMYCKAHFGQDNPNEEMRFWLTSYEMHVDALLNSGANTYAEEPKDGSGDDGEVDAAPSEQGQSIGSTGEDGSTGSTGATGSIGSTGATDGEVDADALG